MLIQRVLELLDEGHKNPQQTIDNKNNQTLAAAYPGSTDARGGTGTTRR